MITWRMLNMQTRNWFQVDGAISQLYLWSSIITVWFDFIQHQKVGKTRNIDFFSRWFLVSKLHMSLKILWTRRGVTLQIWGCQNTLGKIFIQEAGECKSSPFTWEDLKDWVLVVAAFVSHVLSFETNTPII